VKVGKKRKRGEDRRVGKKNEKRYKRNVDGKGIRKTGSKDKGDGKWGETQREVEC